MGVRIRDTVPGRGFPELNPANLLSAITFAADKHRRQRRKDADASPYINHPIAVATVLAVEGDVVDEATLLCAILHDTVEDTDSFRSLFARELSSVNSRTSSATSSPKCCPSS